MGLRELKDILGKLPAGDVSETGELEEALARCWHELANSGDGGMTGDKLLGRMEQVRWHPPVLSFVVERHGTTVLGSSRGELQHWEIDAEEARAALTCVGRRQIDPMRPTITKTEMIALAEEIAGLVRCHATDDRIRWHGEGTVHVVTAKLFPDRSAPPDTVAGRRRRFRAILEGVLRADGWHALGSNRFRRANGGAKER